MTFLIRIFNELILFVQGDISEANESRISKQDSIEDVFSNGKVSFVSWCRSFIEVEEAFVSDSDEDGLRDKGELDDDVIDFEPSFCKVILDVEKVLFF